MTKKEKSYLLLIILLLLPSKVLASKYHSCDWNWLNKGKKCELKEVDKNYKYACKGGTSKYSATYACKDGPSLKLKELSNISKIKELNRNNSQNLNKNLIRNIYLQGADIVTESGKQYLYFGLNSDDKEIGYIYKMTLDGNKIIETTHGKLGHINDFAFNIKRGVITTSSDINKANKTHEIDIKNKKVKDNSVETYLSGITYDNKRNCYYGRSGNVLYKLNEQNSTMEKIKLNVTGNTTNQGWTYYNDLIYLPSTEVGYGDDKHQVAVSSKNKNEKLNIYSSHQKRSNLIFVYDLNGKLQWTYYIRNSKINGEIENISFDNSGNAYIGYNLSNTDPKKTSTKIAFYKFSLPKPTMTVTQSTTAWTNKNVNLNITTSDSLGIRKLTIDGEIIKASSSNKYNKTISNNGTSKIKIAGTNLANNNIIKNITVKIDKEKPIVSGVSNKGKYTKEVTIKVKDALSGIKSITLNGNNFTTGQKVKEIGDYTLIATDNVGNKNTMYFSIIPEVINSDIAIDDIITVSSVSKKLSKTNKKFTISLKPEATIKNINLNNKSINLTNNKYTVSATKNGSYKISIEVPKNTSLTNRNNSKPRITTPVKNINNKNYMLLDSTTVLEKTINVTNIDKTPPTISGVTNNQNYETDVQLKVSDTSGISSLIVNGNEINGTSYIANKSGNYEVVTTDNAGNTSTVNFTVNKTTDINHDIDSGNDKEEKIETQEDNNDNVDSDISIEEDNDSSEAGVETDPLESYELENEVREVNDYSNEDKNEEEKIEYEQESDDFTMSEPLEEEEITNPQTGDIKIIIIITITIISLSSFYIANKKYI